MDGRNQRYEPGLDHVRAFAACWIVLYHAFQLLSARLSRGAYNFDAQVDGVRSNNPLLAMVSEGHTAVAMFMVLSGFVLANAALGHRVDYWRFLQNRALRIYPLFIAVILVGMALRSGHVEFGTMMATLLPIGNVPNQAALGEFSAVLWTVPVELQFYLLFPVLIALLARQGTRQIALLILAAVVFRALIYALDGDINYASYFTIVGRIDQFLLGILAACYRRRRGHDWPAWVLAPVAGGAFIILDLYHVVGGYASDAPWKIIWPTVEGGMWALFILAYIPVSRLLNRRVSAMLAAVGTVSFSMYLLHFCLARIVARYCADFVGIVGQPHWVALGIGVLVVLPVTIVLSRLTFAAIEKPFLDMRVRYLVPVVADPVENEVGTMTSEPWERRVRA